ncbi:Helix-turn-helix [Escherichia coli]|nr:Helix-turn-helix [Escherichia coli]STG23567.1 Helix-turn-helix [Escherichia coli]
MNRELYVMADSKRAERIRKAILEHGTYEEVADKTGINVRTLVRIATAKTEPKFSDVIEIAKITGTDLNTLAHGDALAVKEDATERKLITSADGYTDKETTDAHNFIIWNIRTLDKQDIISLARQVSALSSYSYSAKMLTRKLITGDEQ